MLDPSSPGYKVAKMNLLLHLPYSHRSFLRVDSVQALQTDRAVAELQHRCEGMSMREAWFYPYPADDVDAVVKDGFASMKGPIRFGLYFAPRQLPPGKGQTLKMILCRICVGNSICRSEEDIANIHKAISGYRSIYVPGGAGTSSVFNDTYVLHDNTLVVPTHVVAYHLDVTKVSPEDAQLLTWVNQQSEQLLGFCEANLTKWLISTAQSCESVAALRSRLRTQADLPAAVAAQFGEELYMRVPRNAQIGEPEQEEEPDQVCSELEMHEIAASLGVCPPAPAHAPKLAPSEHVLQLAVAKVDELMHETQDMEEELSILSQDLTEHSEQFDTDHFERAGSFRGELVTHMKDYMLTLQVAEERKHQLERAICDAQALHAFFEIQRNSVTKVAMLTQWKHLLAQRVDLKQRLNGLEGLSSLGPTPPESTQSAEITALEMQVKHKSRIVDLLVQRLRGCGAQLSPREEELLALCA